MNKKAIPYLFAFTILLCTAINISLYGQMASNPIIYADVPDPDFVRVGDTYYMTSTTMYFNPGIPIMKSKDLVNWSLVNYCYPVLASTDALNLNNGQEAYGGGTWASSINYKNGTYYVSSFSYTTGKTYIYKTTNIETGPWTTIILNKVYHDHSLFFDDDGKVYFAYGHDDIWLTEMKPDLTGEQSGGVNKIIIPKASSVAGTSFILTAEGTHLQKINGMYYVSNICWPSGKGRTQIIHRSSTVGGTYTGRIAFQSSIGSAQGEYIDTPDGKWYAMFFHDNGSVGRIPDLIPVVWNSGWPTVGVNGQVPATLDIPKSSGSLRGIVDSDEFSSASPLRLQWQWNHNPNASYWSLTQRSGYMRLTNERTDANVLHTTNTLTQRTYGPKCSGYVSLDVAGMKDGDYAGLIALQNKYGFVGVRMNGTSKTIVMVNGTGFDGIPSEAGNIPLSQNTVYLRVDFDFTNKTDKAYFYYSLNGTNWTAIGSVLQMTYDLEHFTGYRFGLFSYATKSSGGYADFNYFRVGADITEAQNSSTGNPTCTPSVITPYIQINGGAWTQASSATLNTGESVRFGPQPVTGGSWTWSGPNGYTATTREILLSNVQTSQSGNYVATYTNAGGCNSTNSFNLKVNAPVNQAPTVSITSPVNNATFTSPASIIINATASDADGMISNVQFYNGTTLLGSDATSPYSFTWNNVAAGTYTLTSKATDNAGSFTTSSAVTVVVNACTPTTITPYVQINGGAWAQTSNASLNSGGNVMFGPQPISGGSWSWTGPNGFSATTREIALTNVQSGNAGNYIATYTNSGGCKSTSTFALTVTVPVTSTTIQCETACSVDGTLNETYNAGFNGTGYVNTDNFLGASATWSVNSPAAQTVSLGIRYAHTTAAGRPMSLSVNGLTQVSNIAFGPTASNTTWVVSTVQITLAAGANTIKFVSTTAQGSPYMDELIFTGSGISAGTCATQSLAADSQVQAVVYPNPSTDAFSLSVSQDVTAIKVNDMNGIEVYSHGIIKAGERIQFGEMLSGGTYTITILYSGGKVEFKKIQKTI